MKRRFQVELIQETNPDSAPALLVNAIAPVLAIGGISGVIVLSLGWSYAWHWFAEWRVPFNNLNIGSDQLIEYGRIVVAKFWWLAGLWTLSAILILWSLRSKDCKKSAYSLLFIIYAIIPWLFSHNLGGAAALADIRKAYEENFAGWHEVHLVLREEHSRSLPGSILQELSKGPNLCYRMIFRSASGIWTVRMNNIGRPESAVFVPEDAILFLRLRPPAGADC